MITITLNKILAHYPCKSGWKKLLRHLGKTQADDEEFPLSVVLDSNGFDDALWCLRCLPEHDQKWRLFAVWCSRRVQHLMTDQRSIDAINAAEKFAHGEISADELDAVWDAARDAAWDAAWAAVWDAARDAAWDAARDAARAAAWDAAGAAVWDAAWDAARAAARDAARDAAGAAVWDAAWDAAMASARGDQEAEFRRIIG